jgi:hypothetical protein
LKNAVETAKIAVDSCYVLLQFLTPLPSIDFREIRGLVPLLLSNFFNVLASFAAREMLNLYLLLNVSGNSSTEDSFPRI